MGAVLTGNQWEEDAFYETGRVEIQGIVDQINEIAPELSRNAALDFGCGIGRLAFNLASHFDSVTGIDISAKMLEIARSSGRMPANVELKLNTRTDLSLLPDNRFDLVVSYIVLQHMPRRYMKAYLSEFIRVAKPGGIIVFQIPTRTVAPFKSWGEKPLRSDNPSMGRLCYRAAIRFLRWIPRKLEHALMTSELWPYIRYLKLKTSGQPHMEMNPWEKKSLDAFIERHGAEVIQCLKDLEVHDGLESYRYFVRKPSDKTSANLDATGNRAKRKAV